MGKNPGAYVLALKISDNEYQRYEISGNLKDRLILHGFDFSRKITKLYDPVEDLGGSCLFYQWQFLGGFEYE